MVIVTGTPGVGKTEVSKLLAVQLKAVHISLAELVKQENLTSGYDELRQTLIADTDKLKKRLQEIVEQSKGNAVIDGHYAADVVPATQVTKAFVLRCSPDKLLKRMEARGFKGSKIHENMLAEILDVCLYEALTSLGSQKVCEIDTTNQTVDATVTEIMSTLKEKRTCNIGIVDWLGKLEEEGKLDQYLKEI